MKVLIAGGAGFIGSTVASACLDREITPVILDNLSTGHAAFVRGRIFYQGDIADRAIVGRIFADHPDIALTVHCAALIVVPDSVEDPLRYYRENVAKSIDFLSHLIDHRCGRLLFSSSAAIYQPDKDFAVDEASPVQPASPYARTKAMLEDVLQDCARAYPLRVISLRYFNPIGADPAMRTGLQIAQPSHVLAGSSRQLAGSGRSRSPGPTGRHATAPGSATTSTSGTSRKPTSKPSPDSTRSSRRAGLSGSRQSTSAQAEVPLCSN